MRIAIVGTGYVGLVTGACLANTGNEVTCLDVDARKIETLLRGECPIYEPGLEELLRRNRKAGRLTFTTDGKVAYRDAEAVFICVGTPTDARGAPDLSAVLAAAEQLGRTIESLPAAEAGREMIVVVKSTVPVGTCARVKEVIAGQTGKRFAIASNPEFLKEGAAIADFLKPDRVVIGVEDRQTGERLRGLYEPFVRQGNPIFLMDLRSSEMVKYAANAMLAMKVSFINEIAGLCEAYGADIDEVRRGMCADRRIGQYFLYPGLGYGGSCFPKDVRACVHMGQTAGRPTLLLQAVDEVNRRQRLAFVRKMEEHFAGSAKGKTGARGNSDGGLKGKRMAMWGVAFKPGTDDIREAPAITLMEALTARGAKVVAYDPAAAEGARRVLGRRVKFAQDMWSAVDGADALVVATNWDEFMHPDFQQLKARMRQPVIFDGRNIYRPEVMREHGFTYYSVGRAPVGRTPCEGQTARAKR